MTALKTDPSHLRQQLLALTAKPKRVIIDEIQKIPPLLDEVHHLIENHGFAFALCGSSARQLKRGHANMLGGRALRFEMTGLVSAECKDEFDLVRMINVGYIPRHYLHPDRAEQYLRSYISDYLKEEIMQEGLVRNIPVFSQFLSIAAMGDTEVLNFSTIARDCGVSSHTIKEHFTILADTLLGHFVPSFTKRPKRRTIQSPKFYFDDVGVVNALAKRKNLEPGSSLFGKAFENWVFHELHAWSRYSGAWLDISYWRLTTGVEVDFIIGDLDCAIEVKAKPKITSDDLKGLRELKQEHPQIGNRIVVSMEPTSRKTDDGILILSWSDFIQRLWQQKLIP